MYWVAFITPTAKLMNGLSLPLCKKTKYMGNFEIDLKNEKPADAKHLFADSASLRYILFLIDSKIKQHDGKIFCSYNEARQYASDCINDNYSDKAVVGMFYLNPNSKEMLITMVETIGFSGDKKNVNQLQLFE